MLLKKKFIFNKTITQYKIFYFSNTVNNVNLIKQDDRTRMFNYRIKIK